MPNQLAQQMAQMQQQQQQQQAQRKVSFSTTIKKRTEANVPLPFSSKRKWQWLPERAISPRSDPEPAPPTKYSSARVQIPLPRFRLRPAEWVLDFSPSKCRKYLETSRFY
jgi:hypothetical protein